MNIDFDVNVLRPVDETQRDTEPSIEEIWIQKESARNRHRSIETRAPGP